ncbi:MAG: hypothetical protein J5767_10290 [Paludibacteraceae bacterium]|nr:hypothetical protein [Paludibacteraceae bacterium]
MSFKTPILILFLLLPLLSFSQLQVNPAAFLQDTVTQKVILEFIEEAQLSADDFLEIRGRGRDISTRLSQKRADLVRCWILNNVSCSIKILTVGISDYEPLIKDPQTDYEREMNLFVDIRVIRGFEENVRIYEMYKNRSTCDDCQKWFNGIVKLNGVESENKNMAGGHEYVDLGLPSGTKWATCNVGATKPEEYGDYFAWGETKTKDVYDEDTYKYFKVKDKTDQSDSLWGDTYYITKYCKNETEGTVDSLSILLPEDDAATVNWGPEWRMPTFEEQSELERYCERSLTEQNGVYGAKYTAKNGNSIFLPAAGSQRDSELGRDVGFGGLYWSSSLNEVFSISAYYLEFLKEKYATFYHVYRTEGLPVRAVLK